VSATNRQRLGANGAFAAEIEDEGIAVSRFADLLEAVFGKGCAEKLYDIGVKLLEC
jgi:hypothetical protein